MASALDKKKEAALALAAKEKYIRENKILFMFPETGPFARDKYKKHMLFFEAGKHFKERALLGGNQVGKSTAGAYETALHLTGQYPPFWNGYRFEKAINCLVAGDTNKKVVDIMQNALLGDIVDMGTGMIPKNCIGKTINKPGVPGAVMTQYVKHVSGRQSRITFTSYESGRKAFQGTTEDLIWLDEEPPITDQIYTEALTRTATTKGLLFCTFTPLSGMSDIILSFLPDGMMPENNSADEFKFAIQIGWDDIPLEQIDQDTRNKLMKSYMPHEKEARMKGIPCIGEGKIYPILEDNIAVDPFIIPRQWPRFYAIDPGWKVTSVNWFAQDPNTETWYIYDEYYRGLCEPAVHVAAINSRGKWMTGVIDYAGASSIDGAKLKDQYVDAGLDVINADKSVDAGIFKMYTMLSEGRLKVMRHCSNWFKEYRLYRYDKHGKPLKEHDHSMDSSRYGVMTGLDIARVQPDLDAQYSWRNSIAPQHYSDASDITGC